MSQIWEASIKDWYEKSRTAHLDYLDLSSLEKPSHNQLAHNLSVVFDRLCLKSKVDIREHKLILEKLEALEKRVISLEKGVKNLSKVFVENRPLTAGEVRGLVEEISAQPKIVEETILRTAKDLDHKIEGVEKLLLQLK